MALVKAKFVLADNTPIPVHFNPSEYSITLGKRDSTAERATSMDTPQAPIGQEDTETLSMTLYFDTYTQYWDQSSVVASLGTRALARGDVRAYTEEIVKLAKKDGQVAPVSFVWGSLQFKGIITSVSQKFTMFLDDGKPVRAQLEVTMVRNNAIANATFGTKSHSLFDMSDQSWKATVSAVVAAGKLRDVFKKVL